MGRESRAGSDFQQPEAASPKLEYGYVKILRRELKKKDGDGEQKIVDNTKGGENKGKKSKHKKSKKRENPSVQ